MAEDLTIMIVGSGAREHVISDAYEKNPRVKKIVVAPGNDFIAYKREKEVIMDNNCSLKNPKSLLRLAKKYKPHLIDVAQDDAIAAGAVDFLQKNGFATFGPKKKSARLEWDKKWSRKFMKRHRIPSPEFQYFSSEKKAKEYAKSLYDKEPEKMVYVKAAGLCAGKGALKAINLEEAIRNIEEMKGFGKAGKVFLIEEGLVGEEFSYYAISDGRNYHILKSAQDNKTVFNFDLGDQTGGMGAISPAMITEPIAKDVEEQMIARVIKGMEEEGNPYKGILYLGGIVVNGRPMNIEYNARWGDPECQAVLPAIKTDYLDIVMLALDQRLNIIDIEQDNKSRVCIVGASRGYPNDYSDVKGKRIYGLEEVMKIKGVNVYGSGIAMQDGKFYANGGRLFSVVAEGRNILEAKQKAYSAIAGINIEGNNLHYRTDMGWRDVERFLKGL